MLPELIQRHRVMRLDLPGHGQSPPARSYGVVPSARLEMFSGVASTVIRTATWACIVAAAGVGVWRARHFGERVTDRLFRRPSGRVAMRFYREAKPHHDAFRETLAALALDAQDHLLEIGSGGGTFLEWALATGCIAKAVDHSTEMLALASRRNAPAIKAGRLELRQSDATRLPFSDGEFTAAAAINCFFFFDEPQAVLAEVHRTLAPTGRIAVHTLATAPPLIARRMHLYSDGDLVRMFEDAGYEHIELQRTGAGALAQLVTARRPDCEQPMSQSATTTAQR